MTFNAEQLQALYPAQIHFQNVINDGFIRNAPSWLTERIVEIYKMATGRKLTYQRNCATCVKNIYTVIGKLYFEDLKIFNKTNEKRQTNGSDGTKNKRGRRSNTQGKNQKSDH